MIRRLMIAGVAAVTLAGCGESAEAEPSREVLAAAQVDGSAPLGQTCSVAVASSSLPDELRETSGLAQSRRDPTLFWTHNDAGNASELFGIGAEGTIRQRIRISGAALEDWEDIEAGRCASGTCLFLGDIGDNDAERPNIVVYRIPEPDAGSSAAEAPIALRARYPEGPQDAEALIVSEAGEIYVVTKGRAGPIRLYKFPARESNEVVTLELVKELLPRPENEQDRVTSGTLSADGRWVGIRSYANLYLYDAVALLGAGESSPQVTDLSAAGHENGESIAIAEGGAVWVTSEAGGKSSSPEWARLHCPLAD